MVEPTRCRLTSAVSTTRRRDRRCVVAYVASFLRSSVPSLLRSFVPSFLCSFVPSFLRSFVPSFLRSFVPSFLRSFVPSSFRSFVPSFAMVLSVSVFIGTYCNWLFGSCFIVALVYAQISHARPSFVLFVCLSVCSR